MTYVTEIPYSKWKHARNVMKDTPKDCPYLIARKGDKIWGVFPKSVGGLTVAVYIAPIQRPNTSSSDLYIPTKAEELEMMETVKTTMEAM